jgi:FixJ family two-component response regulator
VKTVDVHRTKIKEKMGVTSIAMLVREVLHLPVEEPVRH